MDKQDLVKFIGHLADEGFTICDTTDVGDYYPATMVNLYASIDRFGRRLGVWPD